MFKKLKSFLCLSLSVLLVACSADSSPAGTSNTSADPMISQSSIDPIELKNDFYEAVNGEWLDNAVIPADQAVVGGFSEIGDSIDELLMKDFDDMLNGTKEIPNEELKNFVEFYRLFSDFETRESLGVDPLLPRLESIEQLTNLADYSSKSVDIILSESLAPFGVGVQADMGNASQNALYFSAPRLFLGDKSYYEDEATKAQLQSVYSEMSTNLLIMTGKTQEEAEEITKNALTFDESLVSYIKSAEESSDFSLLYNPTNFMEFSSSIQNIDFVTLVSQLVDTTPETVIVTDPKFFAAFDQLVNEDTFSQMKSWMTLQLVINSSSYLTEEMRVESSRYTQMLTGITETTPKEESAYYSASSIFSEVTGIYYGKTYFGEESKKEVTEMVVSLIDVYKERLSVNTWLSDETKAMAIKKLESMTINIAYPEEAREVYQQLKTLPAEDGGTLMGNAENFTKIIIKDQFSKLNKPVDRGLWPLSADTVNAMYSPMDNSINFPAAILQAPFYSKDQSISANYGGIGAVIGHEISHAFDPNGSMFDENGSLNNWWTEEDYAKFNELTQAMVKEFDGLPFSDGTVNGTLTLTENVADAGGLSCALEAIKQEENPDLEDFFVNWAIIWREKSTPEYEAMVLLDVHAPNKLRANIQLQNFEDFFITYDIVEGDGMYRAPEDRVSIW